MMPLTTSSTFEIRGKVVKSFLGKDPMYNQNLNVKATTEDISRIKSIVLAAPNSDASRPSFEWPFEVNKEGVFKFVNVGILRSLEYKEDDEYYSKVSRM